MTRLCDLVNQKKKEKKKGHGTKEKPEREKVFILAKWPIRPELIPVSVA